MNRSFLFGGLSTLSVIAIIHNWYPAQANSPDNDSNEQNVQTVVTHSLSQDRRSPVVKAVEQVAPSVVAITTEVPSHNPFMWTTGLSSSEGSGVVIDSQGIVLTNAHVVEGAVHIQAMFADEKT